jgi:hypothetical protein
MKYYKDQRNIIILINPDEDGAMAIYTGRKEVVAAFMESPLYFTMPLKQRLALMKQVEQKSYLCNLRRDFLIWIKTGILKPVEDFNPPGRPEDTT